MRSLVLVIALAAACGTNTDYQPPNRYNPAPTGDAPGGGDAPAGDPGPAPTCSSSHELCGTQCVDTDGDTRNCGDCYRFCQAGEICSAGDCVTLPEECPAIGCPSGSFCDPTSDQCAAGCLDDDDCSSKQICENNDCVAGCRQDTSCAFGEICTGNECWEGCRNNSGCPSDQVCEANQCRDACFDDDDCPLAQVCYLPTNLCVPGCDDHDRCPTGQVCDPGTEQCRAGCLEDDDCPGEICDSTTLTCRDGCRSTSECDLEQVCDTGAATCVPGCDDDLRCNTGRICDQSYCRDGCREDDDCGDVICDDVTLVCREGCRGHSECDIGDDGSFCDPVTATCTAGCANGSTASYTDMSNRCPVDEACQENGTCAARCWSNSGVSCNPTGDYICYWNGDEYPTYSTNNCRLPCTGDLDCPTGQICTSFWIYWSDTEDICAEPCDVAGCWGTDSKDGNGSQCACATDGFCHVGGEVSGTLCRGEDGYYGR